MKGQLTMFTRFVAITAAALAFAPVVASAEEGEAVDAATLNGKIDSLAEQYAETKQDVASLKKLKLSGYIQARYGWSEAANFNTSEQGTATTPAATPAVPQNQGFFIRRGRFKAVYDADLSQYVLQIDVIPTGVSIKEGYATVKLPAGFAVDAGLQLFPFGYEVYSRSSADLDTLERALVTRKFIDGEYDLGVALRGKVSIVNFKVGLFNGNGIKSVDAKGTTLGLDNDQLKDVIGRATVDLGMVTAGVSGWYGKTKSYFRSDDKEYDRVRAAADVQVYLDLLPIGGTALKGEFIWGRNPIGGTLGVGANTPTSGTSLTALPPTGHGWYATLVQTIAEDYQVAVRYEQYTANNTLSIAGPTNTNKKRNDEIQVATHWYIGEGYKLTASWYHPMLAEYGAAATGKDPKQDQFFLQAQAKF
jgi:hypothetical protein